MKTALPASTERPAHPANLPANRQFVEVEPDMPAREGVSAEEPRITMKQGLEVPELKQL